jgi:aminopeptidase
LIAGKLQIAKETYMADPRVTKLAQVLVRYSLDIQPGELFYISTNPLAESLTQAVYEEAIKAGAYVTVNNVVPGLSERFFKYANDEQLTYLPPVQKMIYETYDANLQIGASYNTRSLAGIDPARQRLARKASADLMNMAIGRSAKGEFKWTPAGADALSGGGMARLIVTR